MAFTFPNPNTTTEFTADNGITYSWDPVDGKWVVKGFANAQDPRYVNKKGGDSMEGPLTINNNPDGGGSRESRRVVTLGVFSNSENSALRLGTTQDRIYVGHNDTSFNGPVKLDEIHEKNTNNGIKIKNELNLDQNKITNLADGVDDKDAVNLGQLNVNLGGLDTTYLKLDASNSPITGNLDIDKTANGPANGGLVGQEAVLRLKGDRTNTTNASATIEFNNASSVWTGYLTYRSEKDGDTAFFKFNRDLELSTKLKTNTITTRSGDNLVFDKRLDFTNSDIVNARFQKGLVIKKDGQSIDGSNIFTAYNDFVEYDGPTDSDKRIANRKWIWDNTVRDYNINSNWGLTAGQYINSSTYGKVNNPGGSLLNKHNYEFLISASGYGSFYVIGNDACVRNSIYVNSYAEGDNPKGNRVATVSSSRSLMSGMRQAILDATDFDDLKARLIAKLQELENSNEFSEDPT